MLPLLKEAKRISMIILIFCGCMYIFSAILIQGLFFPSYLHFISFLHAYSFFPTLCFLGIYCSLLGFAKSTQATTDTSVPRINIILGTIASVLSLFLIYFLL